MFDTRFWSDNYVADLDPIEKLVFIYTITSHRVSLCGIYELPLKIMALETGIDKDTLPKLLKRLEKDRKVAYRDGWICVVNYPKHQSYNKTTMATALEREIKQIPKEILDIFIGYGYPIDTLGIGYKEQEQDKEQVKEVKVSDGFSEFWSAYPRKVGKSEAGKAWQKHKPDLAVVLKALEAQKQSDQWQRDGGKFIPHPSTWLNQKRWEDEVETFEVINLDK